jgi:ElaB/YqjD/DUF883 family membrane-anchored ribosome-binding protein
MPEKAVPAKNQQDLESELNKSKQSSARLLDDLARKVGSNRTVRIATRGVQRAAHYVQEHSAKDIAVKAERLVRKQPIVTIAAAVAAGFLVGRAIRR